jgi:hypothetical protein
VAHRAQAGHPDVHHDAGHVGDDDAEDRKAKELSGA